LLDRPHRSLYPFYVDDIHHFSQVIFRIKKFKTNWQLTNEDWQKLFNQQTKLIELDLGQNAIDELTLLHIAKHSPKVRKIIVPNFEGVMLSGAFLLLLSYCNDLTTLNLGSSKTTLSLKFRMKNSEKVRFIQIHHDRLTPANIEEFINVLLKFEITIIKINLGVHLKERLEPLLKVKVNIVYE
jgi:hypothetical protein